MPDESPTPPTIADYELLRLIGSGSYGDVWLARGVTGIYRAIKIVWRARFADAQPYEREFRGLKEFAAISLAESRQLALLHVGRNEGAGFFYYVMELADDASTGREIDPASYVPNTLKEVRTRRGRLPAAEVVALAVDLARALAGLHTRGLVHRDIKPSNVILVGGVPKLADIGLVATASAAHTFVGTEGYVPPEGPGAPSADVFSLGKLLYELATGLDRQDYPRLPAELDALTDRRALLELNEVLIRACEPEAAKRFADAGALLEELLLLQAGKSVRRLRSAERRLGRSLRVAAALALAAGVAGAGAWVEHRRAARAEAELIESNRHNSYSSALVRAQRAIEISALGQARQLLFEQRPGPGERDLRGFEWAALWREAQGDPHTTISENGRSVLRLRMSHDGKLLAVHRSGRTVALYETGTCRLLRQIPGMADFGGFSSDDRWLVGTNRQRELQRWSVETGVPDIKPADGTNRPLAALGTKCGVSFVDATGHRPGFIRVWNFDTHEEVDRLTLVPDVDQTAWEFYRAAVSADGRLLALATITGRSRAARWKWQIFDLKTHKSIYEARPEHRVSALAFDMAGAKLAMAYGDVETVGVFDMREQVWKWTQTFGSGETTCIAFSPDDTMLAMGGSDSLARYVDAKTGNILAEYRGQAAGIGDVAWFRPNESVVTGSGAGDVYIWSKSVPPATYTLGDLDRSPAGDHWVSVSDRGHMIAVPQVDHRVRVVNADSLRPVALLDRALLPVAFAEGQQELWTFGADGGLQRWAAPDYQLLQEFVEMPARTPMQPGVSVDRRFVVWGDADGHLHWWDRQRANAVTTTQGSLRSIWWCATTPDGRFAISSGEDQYIRVWDCATHAKINLRTSIVGVLGGAVSPDGRMLALALGNGILQIVSVPELQLLCELRTDASKIETTVFSPDGTRLFCGGTNGVVSVYATEDWRKLVDLTLRPSHDSGSTVGALAISADGSLLAAYLRNGCLRVWRR